MMRNCRGKLPMMIIIIVAVVVLLGGVAAFVMKSGGKKGAHKKVEKGPVVSMPAGDFVVNLADTGEVRYLKTSIVLEVSGEVKSEGGGHGGEGAGPDPKVRDAIIEVLSSKHFAELAKPGGREELKKSVIAAVNERLEGAKVEEVYFNEFAMQ